jgi:hypothetical protein
LPLRRGKLAAQAGADKKKLPRSPNRSDALAMLFWEMDYAKLTAKQADTSDITSPTRRRRERREFSGSTWDD